MFSWEALNLYPLLTKVVLYYLPVSYLEIGVWKGDSLRAALKPGSIRDVVLCDPFIGHCGGPKSPDFLPGILEACQFTGHSHVLHGASRDKLDPYLEANPERQFDLALIDGSHTYLDAYADLSVVVPRAKVTLVHDLNHETVWEAFAQYVAEQSRKFWVIPDNQGTGVIGAQR